jgi:adenosylcobinamide-GDP ribazoletransferase
MGKALLICFGMFTKLPVPIVEWEEKKGAAALSFFPFVGMVCGLVTYFVAFLTRLVSLSETLSAMFILFSLFLIAGFVHLDGFMDTADAFLSARDRERKIAILKDSKVGAFSVIAIVLVLLTLYVSLRSLLLERVDLLFFLFVPMLSRAYAASALFTLKPLQNKGILAYFRDGKTGVHIAVSVISVH